MSTSLLYHGFGIRGYHYVKADYEGPGGGFGESDLAPGCVGSLTVVLHT